MMAKVDPYLRPLFDALHDMLDPEKVSAAPGARRDRDRAAGVHARQNAQRLLRDPRRGTEHHAGADEDVPHAPGLRLADGRDGRHHAGGPAARAALGPDRVGDVLETVEGIEFVRFGGEDVVRHKLVQRIVEAYDEHSRRSAGDCVRRIAAGHSGERAARRGAALPASCRAVLACGAAAPGVRGRASGDRVR